MYRVSGAGYRFKPPQTTSSWAGGPLVESETTESHLSQSVTTAGAGPALHYSRSPVCRLLEQTQFVATPTEDQHRPRPSGPPAFASPAYFLPSLSWLRLPMLRQAWPGDGGSPGGGNIAVYNAAKAVQCDCGETTHHWPADAAGQWVESRTDDDPEYSEIVDGPPQYSTLAQRPPPHAVPNSGMGPYEYEMQETPRAHGVCECYAMQHHHPRSRGSSFMGNEHRYEKLWPCSEGEDSGSSSMGTGENGWLSRYRLPSPSVLGADSSYRRGPGHGHAHLPDMRSAHGVWNEGDPFHAHRSDAIPLSHSGWPEESCPNHTVSGRPSHPSCREADNRHAHRTANISSYDGWAGRERGHAHSTDARPNQSGWADRNAGHAHSMEARPNHDAWIDGRPGHVHRGMGGVRVDDVTSSCGVPACGCSSRDPAQVMLPSACDCVQAESDRAPHARSEMKYINPVYEGRGGETPSHQGASPVLSRLWGYVGLNNQPL